MNNLVTKSEAPLVVASTLDDLEFAEKRLEVALPLVLSGTDFIMGMAALLTLGFGRRMLTEALRPKEEATA